MQAHITTVTAIIDYWWGADYAAEFGVGSASGLAQRELEFEPGYIDTAVPLGEYFLLTAVDGTEFYCRDFIVEPQGPIIDEH